METEGILICISPNHCIPVLSAVLAVKFNDGLGEHMMEVAEATAAYRSSKPVLLATPKQGLQDQQASAFPSIRKQKPL